MPGEPVCTLIVFCDYVITEAISGKNSLIGTFPTLASPQFPHFVQQFFIHVTISNYVPTGQPINFAVNLKQVASGAVIGSVGSSITVPIIKGQSLAGSGMQFNMNVPFRNVSFPAPGAYKCEVLFNGEPIGERILELVQVAQRQMPFLPPQQQQPPAPS
jgi:hypothetical protein